MSHASEFWNGPAGDQWTAGADGFATLLAPLSEPLLAHANIQPGEGVLSVGCGADEISPRCAALVGNEGAVLGVDISRSLVGLASRRYGAVPNLSFEHADIETWRGARFDVAISRLGIMFFDDPVKAFANLRAHCGRLCVMCWQDESKNENATWPLAAVFGSTPPAPAEAAPSANPYVFGHRERLQHILGRSGWNDVTFHAWEGALPVPGDDPVAQSTFLAQRGRLSRVIKAAAMSEHEVIETLAHAIRQRTGGGPLLLDASVWIVTAH